MSYYRRVLNVTYCIQPNSLLIRVIERANCRDASTPVGVEVTNSVVNLRRYSRDLQLHLGIKATTPLDKECPTFLPSAPALPTIQVGSGNIVVLRPVLGEVVELPLGGVGRIFDGRAQQLPRRAERNSAQHPAVVVKPPHAEHLEILRMVSHG